MDESAKSEHFCLIRAIGTGRFGGVTIAMGKHLSSGSTVAVRVTDLDLCSLPLCIIQHEVEMHRMLRHRNIMPVWFCFLHDRQLWTVQPCAGFGSCRDVMSAHFETGLPELAIAFVVRDVIHALDYLHSRSIIHRCVKASHILIRPDGTACLSGLRHCCSMLRAGARLRAVHDFPELYRGHLQWASPELLEQNLRGYNTLSDMYSLGVTLCELANGVAPFQDMQLIQMLLCKMDGMVPRLLDMNTIPELREKQDGLSESASHDISAKYARVFSPDLHDLVEICLRFDAESRKPAAALLTHPFVKQLKKKSKSTSLVQLLRPLNPITSKAEDKALPAVEEEVKKLYNAVEGVTLDDEVAWIF